MSRNAHAWFLIGIILAFLGVLTIWLTALAVGQMWASEWGIIVPFADLAIFASAFWSWRRRWKRLRRPELSSREIRCRWFSHSINHLVARN